MTTCTYFGQFEVSNKNGKNFKKIYRSEVPAYVFDALKKEIEDVRFKRRDRVYGGGSIMFALMTEKTTAIVCNRQIIYSKMHNICKHASFTDKDGRIYRYHLYPRDINNNLEEIFLRSVEKFEYAIRRGILDDLQDLEDRSKDLDDDSLDDSED